MDSQTVQAVGVIAAAMVTMLAMLWGVMALVTKTVMHQVRQWQQDMQKTLDGITAEIAASRAEAKADIAASRAEVKADLAASRSEVKTDIAEVKADIAAFRNEVKAEIAASRSDAKADTAEVKADIADVNARLDRQADQMLDVRNQVATLSERMARVEERVGIPAEPIVTA